MAAASISSDAAYTVDYSCRFDKSTPAYLSYTPGSAGDRRQITMSYWQKRCNIGGQQITFQSGSTYWQFGNSNEEFNLLSDGSGNIKSTRIFRDISAWYHFVISFDTEQDVPSNRIRVWVNGIPITDWSTLTAPTKDTDLSITNTVAQVWGVYGTSTYPMDGYLSQVCMIDGLALNATSFGEFDDNGVWRPIDITGLTFGTTGYLLDFADSSALGNDVSGNNNDFTSSGLVAADQFSDTPTKNYCTFNPLFPTGAVTSDGNLSVALTGTSTYDTTGGSMSIPSTGKWYFEVTCTTLISVNSNLIGIAEGGTILTNTGGISTDTKRRSYRSNDGNLNSDLNISVAYGDAYGSGEVIGVAVDMDNGAMYFRNEGVWQNSGVPTSGASKTGAAYTDLITSGWTWTPFIHNDGTSENIFALNCGQFAYEATAPSGYSDLNTANLPEPTIKNSKKYYDTILYEGNGDSQKAGQFQPITETYTVGNSALFIKGDSTELRKTFGAAASNTKEGTLSMWLKIGQITGGAGGYVVTCGGASGDFIKIDSGLIKIQLNNETNGQWTSTNKLDDTTQWTNLVVTYDLDNVTATDRIQIYINGVNITDDGSFGTTVSDSAMKMFQNGEACAIGGKGDGAADYLYDGYMAEVVWCDGQVLTPSSFGEVDSTTNRWIPKDVSGLTFGNNGFYLNMADKNDLGDDESGNTNDWTESGFDTTNGSNQYYDTPTRNFAIMDPGRSINETMTKGNLLGTSGGATGQVRTPNAFGLTSGKWYFEYLMTNGTTNERTMYITQDDVAISATQIRSLTGHYSGYYSYDGNSRTPGKVSSTIGVGTAYGATYTSGDVISVALDLDIGAIWWGKNGTWQNSATELEIEAGTLTNAAQINLASGRWYPTMQNNTTQASQMNFGQHLYYDSTALTLDSDADGYFRHSVPDGFKAIHVDHLTESDSFQSAFSWIKNRDAIDNHMDFDRVRGPFSFWHANTDANILDDVDTLTRFLKQGATIGDDVRVNTANESYVYWDWFIEATGSGSANEVGSINTAATLVDTTSGISISKFTGTGANATVGHGLGVAPNFVILKHFDNTNYSSTVFHSNVVTPTTGYLVLDSNYAEQNNAAIWNSTIPSSTVVSLGSSAASNNSGTAYMMYCFAEIEGFSKFGTYTGNGTGSGGGPFTYTGFKPNFIMCKAVDRTSDWYISDIARNKFNSNATANRKVLYANGNSADADGYGLQIFSNGFKQYDGNENNSLGNIYCYVAFADNPFGGASTTPGTAF